MLLVQETIQAMMLAWRQGLNPTLGDGKQAEAGAAATAPAPRYVTPDYNKATQDFKRKMPSFELGSQTFEQFKMDLHLSADQSGFNKAPFDHLRNIELRDRRDECLKDLMYQCLQLKAKRLAGWRLYPTSDKCKALTIKDYCAKLQLLLKAPPAESETAFQKFLA